MKTVVQLLFGIGTISNPSGVEKVFAQMSNLAIEKGYALIDICNDERGKKLFYPLNEKVEFYNLGLGKIKVPFYTKIIREIAKIFKLDIKNYVDQYRTKILSKHIDAILENRDIYAIICYELNAVLVANLIGNKAPKIAMLHNPVEELIEPLTKWQLREADKMDAYQVLMPSFVEKAKKYLTTKVVCIPNIVPQIDLKNIQKKRSDKKIIINIGRIEKRQKCQHILVEAFAKIAHKFPEWELHLYGPVQNEKYKKDIENFIKNNDLGNSVFFKGITKEPLQKFRDADLFGFPSAYEGFALVLAEAMSMGLSSIGFKYALAVNELIKDGENGFLCENIDDFADKLEVLMKDEKLRLEMGINAHNDMLEYSSDKIWEQWEKLFDSLNTRQKNIT